MEILSFKFKDLPQSVGTMTT